MPPSLTLGLMSTAVPRSSLASAAWELLALQLQSLGWGEVSWKGGTSDTAKTS